jgi:hypothetical protein
MSSDNSVDDGGLPAGEKIGEMDGDNSSSLGNSHNRKRSADEADLTGGGSGAATGPEQEAKMQARREANRMHAFKSRQRSKLLLGELQVNMQQLSSEKSELERQNAVLRAQVEVLQQQNRALLQSQQQLMLLPGGAAQGSASAGGGGGTTGAAGGMNGANLFGMNGAYGTTGGAGPNAAANNVALQNPANFMAGLPFNMMAGGGVPSLMQSLGLMTQQQQQQQQQHQQQQASLPTFNFALPGIMAPQQQPQQVQQQQQQPSMQTANDASGANAGGGNELNFGNGGGAMTFNANDINSMLAAAAAAISQGGSVPGLSELFKMQAAATSTAGGGNPGTAQQATNTAPGGMASSFGSSLPFSPNPFLAQLHQQQPQGGSAPSQQDANSQSADNSGGKDTGGPPMRRDSSEGGGASTKGDDDSGTVAMV